MRSRYREVFLYTYYILLVSGEKEFVTSTALREEETLDFRIQREVSICAQPLPSR